jgi:hypothetical protein
MGARIGPEAREAADARRARGAVRGRAAAVRGRCLPSARAGARVAASLLLAVAAVGSAPEVGSAGAAPAACPIDHVSTGYASAVTRALAARQDPWGEALLRSSAGPTYEGIAQDLTPLFYAGHVPGRPSVPLTDSGAYYLPFAMPQGTGAPGPVALHLADGGEIVSDQAAGSRLAIGVGPNGDERYGSCVARLGPPALAGGYLPILETRYVDALGVRYQEESFVARIAETATPVSFVRLLVDSRGARSPVLVRFTPSIAGLAAAGGALARNVETYMFFSAGGTFTGSGLTYAIPAASQATLYVAWLVHPSPSLPLALGPARYGEARRAVIGYWQRRLAGGVPFVVPEPRVLDAERSLLIQNLIMGWRYSVGNPYEEFEYPESLDAVGVMGEYGYGALERATLATSLADPLALYPNWEMGTKLLDAARYFDLSGDRAFLGAATAVLRGYVTGVAAQLDASRLGLLGAERWASDLSETGYALDSQAVVWEGLEAIAGAWSGAGNAAAATEAADAAARLGSGLRRAVAASEQWLPDGSLFVPVELYAHTQPYGAVTDTRDGSYWNLTIPYALASGLLPPGGSQAQGVLRYLREHGSRFLGLLRMAAYSLSASPGVPTQGSDDVYLLDTVRFFADNDQPDELDLSLYGQLAAGMTPGTFVSGESETIAPTGAGGGRSMYLPPNSASNAAFLETLRLTLVHEIDRNGAPVGLELAYATPRAWLQPGRTIRVVAAPTSFGPLSFTIQAFAGSVQVRLTVPGRTAPGILRLRLRLPDGRPLRRVVVNGSPTTRFSPRTETIDLGGRTGTLVIGAE